MPVTVMRVATREGVGVVWLLDVRDILPVVGN
jgi:hypothetical protein